MSWLFSILYTKFRDVIFWRFSFLCTKYLVVLVFKRNRCIVLPWFFVWFSISFILCVLSIVIQFSYYVCLISWGMNFSPGGVYHIIFIWHCEVWILVKDHGGIFCWNKKVFWTWNSFPPFPTLSSHDFCLPL